jgi:hypothetical protein
MLNLLHELLVLLFQLAVLFNQAIDDLQRIRSILAGSGGRILYDVGLGASDCQGT